MSNQPNKEPRRQGGMGHGPGAGGPMGGMMRGFLLGDPDLLIGDFAQIEARDLASLRTASAKLRPRCP